MQIHSVQLPTDEAVEFEEHLVADGYLLVLKDDPEELAKGEYLKRVLPSDEDLSGEEFTFIWKA